MGPFQLSFLPWLKPVVTPPPQWGARDVADGNAFRTHQLNDLCDRRVRIADFVAFVENDVVPLVTEQDGHAQSHALVRRHKDASGMSDAVDEIGLQIPQRKRVKGHGGRISKAAEQCCEK